MTLKKQFPTFGSSLCTVQHVNRAYNCGDSTMSVVFGEEIDKITLEYTFNVFTVGIFSHYRLYINCGGFSLV